ncbi:hypothetical protein HYH03_018098 [Edaphochlamys debaryana]|uniref:Uncharacterized protein n=1 Tax=Edaphochlamys debaryana TaxID=47281 RepID=A0A835XFA4_9CHLO|nr:hypothetical protein HYH03_018098 [Edaphochlamys debaryana]|eukprot:KAG2483018.1 hypothetical protein HYH03_018098 [Edaphochlamys debaryana]
MRPGGAPRSSSVALLLLAVPVLELGRVWAICPDKPGYHTRGEVNWISSAGGGQADGGAEAARYYCDAHPECQAWNSFAYYLEGPPESWYSYSGMCTYTKIRGSGFAVVLGPAGMQPWGPLPVFAKTPAKWIWSLALADYTAPELAPIRFWKVLPQNASGAATLSMQVDDACTVRLDGEVVGSAEWSQELQGATNISLTLRGGGILEFVCINWEEVNAGGVVAALWKEGRVGDPGALLAWTDGSWNFTESVNLALGKWAVSSSVDSNSDSSPYYAIDGDHSGDETRLFQTDYSDYTDLTPWLAVDLFDVFSIERVVIYNRNSDYRYSRRLMNAELRIGMRSITRPSDSPYIGLNELVWTLSGRALDGMSGRTLTANFQPRAGRFVTLQNFQLPISEHSYGDNWVLHVYELEVFGLTLEAARLLPYPPALDLSPPPLPTADDLPPAPTPPGGPAAPAADTEVAAEEARTRRRVPGPEDMVAPVRWTHRCQVVITSGESSLSCTTYDPEASAVRVAVGDTLLAAIRQQGPVPDDWETRVPPHMLSTPSYPPSTPTVAPPPEDLASPPPWRLALVDWGVTLSGAEHLLLEDSLISGVPLSSLDALLHITNCAFVTIRNLTIEDVQGVEAYAGDLSTTDGSDYNWPNTLVYGAVRVTDASGVAVQESYCSAIWDAHGWSCFWIQLAESQRYEYSAPWAHVVDSSMSLNKVSWGGPWITYPLLHSCWTCEMDVPKFSNTYSNPDYSYRYGLGALVVGHISADGRFAIAIENTAFLNNTGGCGAALAVPSGIPSVSWSAVNASFNSALKSGGAAFFRQGTAGFTLEESQLDQNYADRFGGAVYAHDGGLNNVMLTSNTSVYNNVAMTGAGFFSYAAGITNMTVDSTSSMTYNVVYGLWDGENNNGNGGGLFAYRGGITNVLIRGRMDGNLAQDAYGGAMYSQTGNITGVTLEDGGTLFYNYAEKGGAVYVAMGHLLNTSILRGSAITENRAVVCGGAVATHFGGILGFVVSDGSVIAWNWAERSGGALHSELGGIEDVVIQHNSTIHGNYVSGFGGAICSSDSAIVNVAVSNGSSIYNNSAVGFSTGKDGGYGGAFSAVYSSIIGLRIMANSSLARNYAYSSGGALSVQYTAMVIVSGSSTIADNSAEKDGGAIYGSTSSWVNVRLQGNSTMDGNSARNGGAIAGASLDVTLDGGSSLSGNVAAVSGGALLSTSYATFQAANGSRVSRNEAKGGSGGAINASSIAFQLIRSSLESNKAGASGGALFANYIDYFNLSSSSVAAGNSAGVNGGVAYSTDFQGVGLEDANVSNNQAVQSGGVFCASRGILSLYSVRSVMTGNSAAVGSGGIVSSAYLPILNLSDSSLTGNSAAQAGGALFVANCSGDSGLAVAWQLSGSNLSGNQAGRGGAIALQGTTCSVQITDGALALNAARNEGGAIAVLDGAQLNASTLMLGPGNTAAIGGGLYAGPGSAVNLTACVLANNSATDRGGSLGAIGCASLLLDNATRVTSSSCSGDGGGISVNGCSRVVLTGGSRVSGNVGGRGGGLHVGPRLNAAPRSPASLQQVLVCNGAITGNTAALVPAAAQPPKGYGGGMFVEHVPGLAVLVSSDSSVGGNVAWLGADVASLQQCPIAPEQGWFSNADLASSALGAEACPSGGLTGSALAGVASVESCSVFVLRRAALSSNASSASTLATLTGGPAFTLPAQAARPLWVSSANTSLYVADSSYSSGDVAQQLGPLSAAGLLELPPAAARVTLPSSCKINARTSLRVELLDSMGQRVSSAPATSGSYTVVTSVAAAPAAAAGVGSLYLQGSGAAPWQRSVKPDGSAEISGTINGYPGLYTLRVTTTGPAGPIGDQTFRLMLEGCSAGEAAVFPEPPKSQRWIDGMAANSTCVVCAVRSVGIYGDPRALDTPSSERLPDGPSMSSASLAASQTCRACPPNAVCPGGSNMAPLPGFWHSSPRSSLMNSCPNEDACTGLSSALNSWWRQHDDDPGTADLIATLQDLDATGNRSVALVSARRAVLAGALDTAVYIGYQCAEGYAGNMCATCQPGYHLDSDFQCGRCPELARTIGLGLIALSASVLVILYGAVTNMGTLEELGDERPRFGKKYPPPPPSDILKVLVVHVQYFLIIARLNFPKPEIVRPLTSLLAAATGAESSITYSHACLLRAQDSAGQAYLQVLGALLTPCAATFVALLVWLVRYRCFNSARLRRSKVVRRGSLSLASSVDKALSSERFSPGHESNVSVSGQHAGLHLEPVPVLMERASTTVSSRPSAFARRLTPMLMSKRSSLSYTDQSLTLTQQLGLVLMLAIFVLFPSWADAGFSIFSCMVVDDTTKGAANPFSGQDFAVATSPYGYWTRNMQQECYVGAHAALYVPLGVVFLIVFCLTPPIVNFVLLWRQRAKLQSNPYTRRVYGFMYSRYRPKYYWWDSVVMCQTLALVAVDVFGRGLDVAYQALMLLLVLLFIAGINATVEPHVSRVLRHMEFWSSVILSATIALNMYFVTGTEDLVHGAGGDAIAIIAMLLNIAIIVVFMLLIGQASLPAIKKALGGEPEDPLCSSCACWPKRSQPPPTTVVPDKTSLEAAGPSASGGSKPLQVMPSGRVEIGTPTAAGPRHSVYPWGSVHGGPPPGLEHAGSVVLPPELAERHHEEPLVAAEARDSAAGVCSTEEDSSGYGAPGKVCVVLGEGATS